MASSTANPAADPEEGAVGGRHLKDGEDRPLPNQLATVRVGLAWDFFEGMPAVDLDVAAVAFDSFGVTLDAAFYNKLSVLSGAIAHSGDSKDGKDSEGFDESIDIALARLPPVVAAVALVVNAYQGGTFSAVESASATLEELMPGAAVPEFLCDASVGCGGDNTGLLLAVLYRKPDSSSSSGGGGGGGGSSGSGQGSWTLCAPNKACSGQTFVDSLTEVRKEVDRLLDIDEGLQAERTLSMEKTFDMQKGGAYVLPQSLFVGGDDLFVGLGWSCPGSVDLDASCIAVYPPSNGRKGHLETIFFARKAGCGHPPSVKHQGDNVTGAGAGDDEKINVDLDRVPAGVSALFFTVNCYSSSFESVHDAYIRLVAVSNGHELARFKLDESIKATAVIFLKLVRSVDGGTWLVEPIGTTANARMATNSAMKEAVMGGEENWQEKYEVSAGGCCTIA